MLAISSNNTKNHKMFATNENHEGMDFTEATEVTDATDFEGLIQEVKVPSLHQLVNQERSAHNLKPLKRSRPLDCMAQKVVERIANNDDGTKGTIPLNALEKYLNSGTVGQNVECGKSIQKMHQESIAEGTISREMILNRHFKAFGIATAKNEKTGNMYMVQIFRGKKKSAS